MGVRGGGSEPVGGGTPGKDMGVWVWAWVWVWGCGYGSVGMALVAWGKDARSLYGSKCSTRHLRRLRRHSWARQPTQYSRRSLRFGELLRMNHVDNT